MLGRGGRARRVCQGAKRDLVPPNTRPPRTAVLSNSALLLMAQPGFRKVGFFSNREKLPHTSFFEAFFVCLFFFLTNMWINTVLKKKKKAVREIAQIQRWLDSPIKRAKGALN